MQSSGSVPNLLPSLERFADTLSEAYGSQLRAQAEDPLKAPVSELLQSFASTMGFSRLLARPEAPVSGVGRLDLAVAVGGYSADMSSLQRLAIRLSHAVTEYEGLFGRPTRKDSESLPTRNEQR